MQLTTALSEAQVTRDIFMASITTVSAGQDITAAMMNLIVAALNNQNKRVIMTASGNFTWPTGINAIRVYLCGGGGRSSASWMSGGSPQPSARGGNSPLCSKVITGVADGTTIAVGIGAASAAGGGTTVGGTTTFGTYFQSTGGANGVNGDHGTDGTHTGEIQHDNHMFISAADPFHDFLAYGQGYPSNLGGPQVNYATVGGAGICIIEY